VRAALEEGFVPGGGAALVHASVVLDDLLKQNKNTANTDWLFGVKVVKNACKAPFKQIAKNAIG